MTNPPKLYMPHRVGPFEVEYEGQARRPLEEGELERLKEIYGDRLQVPFIPKFGKPNEQ